ncbi:MAG: GspE/PulE family protein [Patescibacteria group bacterium]
MNLNNTDRIKNALLSRNLIDPKDLAVAEAKAIETNKSLEEILVQERYFASKEFNKLKGEIFNLETIDLEEITADQATLNLLAPKVAENYQAVIFARAGDEIKVGLVDPGNFQAHEAIDFLATQKGLRPRYYAISFQDFRSTFNQYSGFKKEIGTAVEAAKVKFAQREGFLKVKEEEEDFDQVVKSAPVAKIVSVIVKHAVDGGASDIHIEPGRSTGRVRYRVDGNLFNSLTLPDYLYNAVISRIKVLANMKLDETRLPQDGRIRFKLDDREVDLRVSVLPTLNQEKVVMRVLDTSAGVPTLAELGFSDYHIQIIEKNIKRPYGLFLLTGPTGSGKTTTLYSVLNILNSDQQNITTLEDPIEYYIDGVNQSQINPDIGFSFASGLRSILRQDPNIIMVGEIRDSETVELVIHAALTGHLVFSTLHTNSAWGAIPRLIDMKAEPFLLASTLNLVMAQRLVRKVCPNCKTEAKLPPKVSEKIMLEIKKIPDVFLQSLKGKYAFYRGQGCQSCNNTGYLGRTVVGEIMDITMELKELMVKDFTIKDIQDQLQRQNYINLAQDAILKALQGLTTIDEVLRVSQDQ